MATSGQMNGSSADGNRVYFAWQIASQSQSGNYTNVNWQVGWNFNSGPSCRGLRSGNASINGSQVYYDYGSGDNIHVFNGGHNHSLFQTGSGTARINHDSAGNGTISVWAGMTGWQGDRSTGSQSWSLTRIPKVPATPSAPTASSISPTGATLTWPAPNNNGAALDRQSGQVSRNSAFTDIIQTWDAAWGTSRNLTGLPKGTVLYARIRARNSIGWSSYSGARTFTTATEPAGAPTSLAISNVTPTTARVTWLAPADNGGATVTSYEMQRSTSPSFTDPVMVSASASPHVLSGLLPGTTYHLRIRAVSSAGSGAWSLADSFATLSGVKVGNGTQWRDAIVWVGNGTQWVLAQVRRGTGAAWE